MKKNLWNGGLFPRKLPRKPIVMKTLLALFLFMNVSVVSTYAQQQKKMEDETFTTSKGEYLTQKVIQHFYNKGVEDGVRDKRGSKERNRNYYHFDGNGTEEQGKAFFVSWFGIPSDENAKEVSNQAIQKYISGYEDGWNY